MGFMLRWRGVYELVFAGFKLCMHTAYIGPRVVADGVHVAR